MHIMVNNLMKEMRTDFWEKMKLISHFSMLGHGDFFDLSDRHFHQTVVIWSRGF